MATLAAPMSMKRKDAGVAVHEFSIYLDPKRIKLQEGESPEMMEEDEPLGHAPTATAPTIVHDKVSTAPVTVSKPSEPPPFAADRAAIAAPMDVEVDARQCQPCQKSPFWPGFF